MIKDVHSFVCKTIFTLIVSIATLLISCSDDSTNNNNGNVVKIGALMPISGSGSSAGESMHAAINLAVDEIKSQGNNCQIELITENTDTNPETALEKLKHLKSLGITFVIGPYSSAELNYIKEYADSNNIFLISPSSVAISLAIENDNIFRLATNDYHQVEAFSKYFDFTEIESLCAAYRNDTWGNSLFFAMLEKSEGHKYQFFNEIKYHTSAIDYTEFAKLINDKIKEEIDNNIPANKIGIFLACFNEGTDILEKASYLSKTDSVKWYGTSAFALNATLTKNSVASEFAIATDFICPVFAPDDNFKSAWIPVSAKLKSILGRESESYALTAYDAVKIAFGASILLKTDNSIKEPRKALIQFAENNSGITGNFSLDKYGDRKTGNYYFWKVRKSGDIYEWYSKYIYNTEKDELKQLD